MKYHCRCRRCETRKVLRMKPDEYTRQPKCPRESCGARDWRIDKWANNRDTSLKGQGCNCSGYWFPHRRGSLYCWYRADGVMRQPGDPDFADRELTDEEIAQAAKGVNL